MTILLFSPGPLVRTPCRRSIASLYTSSTASQKNARRDLLSPRTLYQRRIDAMTLRAVERGSIKFIQGQSRRREVQGRNRYPLASLGRDVCRNSLDAAHNSGEMSK